MPKQQKGKTVSRKAQVRLSARSDSPSSVHEAFADFDPARTALRNALSLQSSRDGSPAPGINSLRHSGPTSHTNSSDDQGDEELASFTDETMSSLGSHEDLTNSYQDFHEMADDIFDRRGDQSLESEDLFKKMLEDQLKSGALLNNTIDELLDTKHRHWKRGSQTRESCLMRYCFLLANHYSPRSLGGREDELAAAFLGSLHADCEDKETVLALRALELTVITCPTTEVYQDAADQLRLAISDSDSDAVKTAALASFGLIAFFAELEDDGLLDNMSFLLEIVSSDGSFINAMDQPNPVIAAMNSYALLATLVDDLSEESDEAVETFMDQLSSSNVIVQVTAAECTALMFEKSFTEVEEAEEKSVDRAYNAEDPNDGGPSGVGVYEGENARPTLVRRYFAYRHRERLEAKLHQMTTSTHRHISKKERKGLNTKMADVRGSLRNPLQGPHYRTTLSDNGTDAMLGGGLSIRAAASDRAAFLSLDKWWQLFRHRALRRSLKDRGIMEHLENNPVVSEVLPVPISHEESLAMPKKLRNRVKTYKAKAGMKTMPRVMADRSMLELDGVEY